MTLSNSEFSTVGKVVNSIYSSINKFIKEKKYPISFADRGDDKSVYIDFYRAILDSVLATSYKIIKSRGINNPPNALGQYIILTEKKWSQVEEVKNVYLLILKRSLDTEKMIDNFKRGVYTEYNRDQLKQILFKREILGKK